MSSRRSSSRFDANPQSAARLTEVERRAVEVAMRLLTYKAYSGERPDRRCDPDHAPAVRREVLAATCQTIKEAREKESQRDLPLIKLDELKALSTYWNDIPREDHQLPDRGCRRSTSDTRPGSATTRSGSRSRSS